MLIRTQEIKKKNWALCKHFPICIAWPWAQVILLKSECSHVLSERIVCTDHREVVISRAWRYKILPIFRANVELAAVQILFPSHYSLAWIYKVTTRIVCLYPPFVLGLRCCCRIVYQNIMSLGTLEMRCIHVSSVCVRYPLFDLNVWVGSKGPLNLMFVWKRVVDQFFFDSLDSRYVYTRSLRG